METKFVDVILPLHIPNYFTYRVPRELADYVRPGQRVVVQFGRSKLYTALVKEVHTRAPEKYTAKYIQSILDEFPIVTEKQFEFWDWISSYYMCYPGEVMNAALPSSLKLASESRIVLHPDLERTPENLDDKEYLIAEALQLQEVLSLDDVSEILGIKTVQPVIKSLIEKRVAIIEEELQQKYRPKTEKYVRLADEYLDEKALETLFGELESDKRAERQLELLMMFIQLSHRYEEDEEKSVSKKDLLRATGSSDSPLNSLVKKDVLELFDKEVDRIDPGGPDPGNKVQLSEEQQQTYSTIKEQFKTHDTSLLHGVTGSGKTEIYIKLIRETIESGKQVLYLLPEIALTTQIINRLRNYFGQKVGIYHSKFNDNERAEVWNKVKSNDEDGYRILLGARSAIFLPFVDLGLVIIDEEHEYSFKQYEPAPRYHARDAGVMLAHMFGAKTLMGSATPAIESYYNAQQDKYGFAELKKRYGGIKLPEILVADVAESRRKKQMKEHFTKYLSDHISQALEKKEQVILFQNRRGYSPQWQCEDCGHVPQCERCDVSLTYHKRQHALICHYCGYSMAPPVRCDACGSTKIKMVGFGTEQIEEELGSLFPTAKVARMDLDTTRSKYAYENIIRDFENRSVDILIGTQMVTKGLDFDHVGLVGILSADQMLNFPDFRSFERSFQLMAQVAGRAGRKKKRGKVIIQTYNPNHWVIQQVIANDYQALYKQEIIERRNFHYPPFTRMIRITVKHKDADLLNYASEVLATDLKKRFGDRVLGPEFPPVARIRNMFLKNITLKLERKLSPSKVKAEIDHVIATFERNKDFKGSRIVIDVDPL